MKRENLQRYVVFLLLLGLGVCARRLFPWHNFWPLSAIALFAGFFFANPLTALAAAFTALTLSNLSEPAYADVWTESSVYGCLAASVAFGRLLAISPRVDKIVWVTVASSILFFLVTNFAVWFGGRMDYEHTWAGLLECYAAGLLFFRNTLSGDLCYSGLLFGAYALAVKLDVDLTPRKLQPLRVRK